MSPRSRRVLVACALAAVAFAHAWPSPSGRVVGIPEGEARQHLWVAWMVCTSLARGELPVHTSLAGFPAGIDLFPLDPANQALVALLRPLAGLVAAFNLAALAAYALAVLGAQRLAGALGQGVKGELVAALLVGTGAPVLGAYVDTVTEAMGAGWWLLLLAELAGPSPRPGRTWLYATGLLLTGPYLPHATVPLFVVLALRRRLSMVAVLGIGLVGLVLALGLHAAEGGEGGMLAERASMAPPDYPPRTAPLGTLAPPPTPDVGVVRHLVDYAPAVETGPRRWVPWALVVAGLLALGDRRGRWLLAASAAYAALAAGSARGEAWGPFPAGWPTPFDLFYRYYPGGELAWKPAQYAVPAYLLLVAAACRAPPRLGLVLGLVAVAESQLRGPTPLPLPASSLHPWSAWTGLAEPAQAPSGSDHPDAGIAGAVVEFPCRDRWLAKTVPPLADSLLGPLWHQRPLGDTLERAPRHGALPLLLALEAAAREGQGVVPGPARRRPPPPTLASAVATATERGFTHLVVVGPFLEPPQLDAVEAALQDHFGAAAARDDEGVILVPLGASAPPGPTPG